MLLITTKLSSILNVFWNDRFVFSELVDAIVTTAGGVEEDLIKCLAPTFIGAFHLDGSTLRNEGINRIGNLLVPNKNYCMFENWLMPILDTMLKEQKESVSNFLETKYCFQSTHGTVGMEFEIEICNYINLTLENE